MRCCSNSQYSVDNLAHPSVVTYLALVTVDQHRVILAIQESHQRVSHLTSRDADLAFIGRNVDLQMVDAVLFAELGITRWDWLRNQSARDD